MKLNPIKNLSDFEEDAIESLRLVKRDILGSIPENDLISIYVKKSLMREINENDFEVIAVVDNENSLELLGALDDFNKYRYPLEVTIRGVCLNELKKRKPDKNNAGFNFLRNLKSDSCRLIYGKYLNF